MSLRDKPAFARTAHHQNQCYEQEGMTLREYYAGMAMQAVVPWQGADPDPAERVAKWAVEYADALIAELEKGGVGM